MSEKIMLWSSDEMIKRSGSGMGTFDSCSPSMTYFAPVKSSSGGCIIIFPGGAYIDKSYEKEGTAIAEMLSENGFHSFVVDYRVRPDHHPSPLNDSLRSVEKARQLADKFGYSGEKITVMGFSAGGHMAACAATMWTSEVQRPDAAILCYPVITMGKYANINSKTNLFGGTISEAMCDDMSCENRVDRQTPPSFIWHTSDDQSVSVENSLLFANALANKAVPFEMHIYPTGSHGLGLASDDEEVSSWTGLCIKWLNNMGF